MYNKIIKVGSVVTIEYISTKERKTYEICKFEKTVTPTIGTIRDCREDSSKIEITTVSGKIEGAQDLSCISLLGKTLNGKTEGETVYFKTKDGKRKDFIIVKVNNSYIK